MGPQNLTLFVALKLRFINSSRTSTVGSSGTVLLIAVFSVQNTRDERWGAWRDSGETPDDARSSFVNNIKYVNDDDVAVRGRENTVRSVRKVSSKRFWELITFECITFVQTIANFIIDL